MRFLVLGSINIDMTFRVDHIVRGGERVTDAPPTIGRREKGKNARATMYCVVYTRFAQINR